MRARLSLRHLRVFRGREPAGRSPDVARRRGHREHVGDRARLALDGPPMYRPELRTQPRGRAALTEGAGSDAFAKVCRLSQLLREESADGQHLRRREVQRQRRTACPCTEPSRTGTGSWCPPWESGSRTSPRPRARLCITNPLSVAATRRRRGEGRRTRRLGVDDNLLLAVDGDDLGRAVWRAAMVDQPPVCTDACSADPRQNA